MKIKLLNDIIVNEFNKYATKVIKTKLKKDMIFDVIRLECNTALIDTRRGGVASINLDYCIEY